MRLAALAFVLTLAASGCRFEPRIDDAARPSEAASPAPAASAPAGQDEVVLYVTEWCPYCAQARQYMADENIPHRIVDIEKDPAGSAEYQARGGDGGIPLVAVGDAVMKGWSPEVARQMLDAAGYE